jgi:hypothetical protein
MQLAILLIHFCDTLVRATEEMSYSAYKPYEWVYVCGVCVYVCMCVSRLGGSESLCGFDDEEERSIMNPVALQGGRRGSWS